MRGLLLPGFLQIATSNRAPDKLYEGGLQRDLFLPFIANLKKRCESFDIMSTVDYRRLARQLLHTNFFVGKEANIITRHPVASSLSEIECGRGNATCQWAAPHHHSFAPLVLKPWPWLGGVVNRREKSPRADSLGEVG